MQNCNVMVYGKSRTQDIPQVLHYLLVVMLKMKKQLIFFVKFISQHVILENIPCKKYHFISLCVITTPYN